MLGAILSLSNLVDGTHVNRVDGHEVRGCNFLDKIVKNHQGRSNSSRIGLFRSSSDFFSINEFKDPTR